jgi:glucose dehydrogenase
MNARLSWSTMIAAALGGLVLTAQSRDFRPVTEAMLRNPAPGDWLQWRRTDNAWGYSPLDQITRQNVSQLQLAWSWSMDDTGAQEAAPIVHDGIMYLPSPRGVIQALDAATGDLIWEYRPGAAATPAPAAGRGGGEQTDIPRLAQRPAAGAGDTGRGIQKTIAIFGDKIFGTTNEAHIVALDARTGKLVWDTTVADERLGYEYTTGPIVPASPDAAATRTTCASSAGTTRQQGKSCGGRPRSRGLENQAAIRGATCRWRFVLAAMPGLPAVTIQKRISCTSGRRRPSRGHERSAGPTALRSTRTRRWRSIPTQER